MILIAFLALSTFSQAQTVVTRARPGWIPAGTKSSYYYIPAIESYYDARTGQYISANNGKWVRSKTLPGRYRTYNLHTGKVVPINYVGNSPYVHYKTHKVKYHKGPHRIAARPAKGNHGHHHGHSKGKGHGHGKDKKD